MNLSEIQLSIVIIVLQGRDKLVRCLSALASQTPARDSEIIVPYDETYPEIATLKETFPDVKLLPTEGHRTYAELRALAIRNSRGRVVAITEDHCIPAPGWAARILEVHARPFAAIGGAVEKTSPDTLLNWSLYLADYVRYANPLPEGPTDNLTDCNVTYKRSMLDAVEAVWRDEFHEPEVHEALQANGEALWFDPGIIVYQQRSMKLSEAVHDRYAFGRLFGARRAMSASWTRRLIYLLLSTILPFLLTGRVAQQVLRKRHYLRPFLYALPHLMLLNTIWAWGEFTGYLTAQVESSLRPHS